MTSFLLYFCPHPAFPSEIPMAVFQHPPQYPDLATCDFFLFPKMKLELKGSRFKSTVEIQTEWQGVLDTLRENDFQEAFQKLSRRWDRCLRVGGNYFEGYDGR
jgi:hypothetical protein